MGQYYIVANLDKKEFLHPHSFGDGLKLLEFGCSGQGTMTALAILLATSNGRGGGDLHLKETSKNIAIPGRWAGDRIAVVGDYDDDSPCAGIYQKCADGEYKNISYDVMRTMAEDRYIAEDMRKNKFLVRGAKDAGEIISGVTDVVSPKESK